MRYRDGGCPNTDTLYSMAWLDLAPSRSSCPPGHGGPVLHLRADGVHLRRASLRRAAHHRQQSRAFRHLRAGLARGRRPGAATQAERRPRGSSLGRTWSRSRRTCEASTRCRRVPAHPAEPVRASPTPRCRSAARSYAPAEAAQDPLGRGGRCNAMLPKNPPPTASRAGGRADRADRHRARPDVDAQPEAVKAGQATVRGVRGVTRCTSSQFPAQRLGRPGPRGQRLAPPGPARLRA